MYNEIKKLLNSIEKFTLLLKYPELIWSKYKMLQSAIKQFEKIYFFSRQ